MCIINTIIRSNIKAKLIIYIVLIIFICSSSKKMIVLLFIIIYVNLKLNSHLFYIINQKIKFHWFILPLFLLLTLLYKPTPLSKLYKSYSLQPNFKRNCWMNSLLTIFYYTYILCTLPFKLKLVLIRLVKKEFINYFLV